MKKSNSVPNESLSGDELRKEYDETLLRSGVRGKYAARYRGGTNLVLLAPDVAAAFPGDEGVNAALRSLMGAKGNTSP